MIFKKSSCDKLIKIWNILIVQKWTHASFLSGNVKEFYLFKIYSAKLEIR